MPALMRPNPVRANLQAGGNVYGTMAFEFFSPGLMAILAKAEADFVLGSEVGSGPSGCLHLPKVTRRRHRVLEGRRWEDGFRLETEATAGACNLRRQEAAVVSLRLNLQDRSSFVA